MHYDIRTCDDAKDVRHRYNVALAKQTQLFILPDGVSVEEMGEIWQQLDYGGVGTAAPSQPSFISNMFRLASRDVKRLRRLAMKGREETERLAQENKDKEVVVLDSKSELTS